MLISILFDENQKLKMDRKHPAGECTLPSCSDRLLSKTKMVAVDSRKVSS